MTDRRADLTGPATCRQCARPLVSDELWASDRAGCRAHGSERHGGRGLCKSCYKKHRRAGTLADFDRRTRPRSELLADIELLAERGLTRRDMAARVGMSFVAFERQYFRLRKSGDLTRTIRRGAA